MGLDELDRYARQFYKANTDNIVPAVSADMMARAIRAQGPMDEDAAIDFLKNFIRPGAAPAAKGKEEKAQVTEIAPRETDKLKEIKQEEKEEAAKEIERKLVDPKNTAKVKIGDAEMSLDDYLTSKVKEITGQVNAEVPDETRKWERDRGLSFWDILIVPAVWKYGISYVTDGIGLTGGEDTIISRQGERNQEVGKRLRAYLLGPEGRKALDAYGAEYGEDGRFYEKIASAPKEAEKDSGKGPISSVPDANKEAE